MEENLKEVKDLNKEIRENLDLGNIIDNFENENF